MKLSLTFTLILLGFTGLAQEFLTPLQYDIAKAQSSEMRELKKHDGLQKSNVTLPFIDDFSKDHFPGNEEGNEVLWQDYFATVQSSFGIDPPSLGVAVFDGLNEVGLPYNSIGSAIDGHADVLTSEVIDLSGKEDVVLSFYFQPQGKGDSPEASDSLVVQFYEPISGTWQNRWHATGSTAFPYFPILLNIEAPYLQDGFQFRFRNYGRITGALDHWSIDWVYLDENRSVDNSELPDVGFIDPIESLLSSDYRSIPWHHYQINSSSKTITQVDVTVRNNRTSSALISSSGYSVSFNGEIIDDFTDSQSPSVQASSDLSITQEINSAPNSFVFPTGVAQDEARFKVEFNFETSPDLHTENNSMSFEQVFDNYYAYDDGQADYAYGITNFSGAGRVAFRYDFEVADTLKAVDMYFLYQALENANLEDQLFYLTIWEESGSGEPGEIVYQDASPRTVQLTEYDHFATYVMEQELLIQENESFFIGWLQPDDNSLNIGNDLSSTQNLGRLFFDAGNGDWTPTGFSGALMIRPVFTPFETPVVGLEEEALHNIRIWPNPARTELYVQGDFPIGTLASLYDVEGRRILTENITQVSNRIDLDSTEEGLYLIEFLTPSGTRILEKIVISR